MAALVISISSDVSVESVGSSFPRVILIGSISVEVPVAPEVGVAAVASPVGVLELVTHSSSEVDPSKSSPPPVSVAPMVLPFLCSDDSKSDTEIPERHVSPIPHDAMLTRWRSRVESRSSSPTTSTQEIPTAPILLETSSIEDIPIGRLYRTYPGGPCRALTAWKSVRPLPSHLLALRYTSHHLDRFTSRSSSGHLSSDHSSSGHSISDHSLSEHTSPDTTVADSSTPLRFGYLPLARTPQCSEAYLHWRSAPLSTMYPPTKSKLSTGDSSSESPAGPSCKRCRSHAATVTSSIHVTRALVPSRADLLLPQDIEADATANEVAVDRDVEAGVDAGMGMEVDVRVDVEDEVKDEVESSNTMEVGVDVVVGIDILDVMLMPAVVEHLEQVEEGLQDIYDHNMTITRSGMTPEAIEELVNRRVEEALAAYEATRAANALEAESQSQNGSDGDNGNGGNGNGGNGNPNENNRGARPVARECTYQDFMKCQPLNFKGTEGVVGLIRWFEKMETVFHISNCPEKYQVKYATCTLLNSALTWWNSHKRTVGTEAAFAMSWRELMKLMAEMVLEEEDRVEKFNGDLPDNIQGNVIAAEPTRLQDVVCIANNLMDQKLKGQNVGGQNMARAYTTGNNEKRGYVGLLPYYNKCKLHHEGPCTMKCGKCNKVGHMARDCKNAVVGHYRNEYPKLKNQNRGNKTGKKTEEARGKAYVMGE
ncbi:putative reverse transcriptase domain-containing protein, partial [Tanacetum coccineum]